MNVRSEGEKVCTACGLATLHIACVACDRRYLCENCAVVEEIAERDPWVCTFCAPHCDICNVKLSNAFFSPRDTIICGDCGKNTCEEHSLECSDCGTFVCISCSDGLCLCDACIKSTEI